MTVILYLLAVSLVLGGVRAGGVPVVPAERAVRGHGGRGEPHPVRRRTEWAGVKFASATTGRGRRSVRHPGRRQPRARIVQMARRPMPRQDLA